MHIGITITPFATYTLPLAQPIANGGRIMTPAGEIAQIVRDQEFRYLAYLAFVAATKQARGNHYHQQKYEYLYVITGRLQAFFADITQGIQEEHILETGTLLEIPPMVAHALLPLEDTQAVEFSATAYDPTDSFPYPLWRG
jgi:dTDP-4-dehydrorhamnose 3,5-epimerase-like enzyme